MNPFKSVLCAGLLLVVLSGYTVVADDDIDPAELESLKAMLKEMKAKGVNSSDIISMIEGVTVSKKASDDDGDEHVSHKLWGDNERPRNYDFYAALQLRKTASDEDIKSAYERLSKVYTKASEGTKLEIHYKIEEAYEVLSNKDTKEIYDEFGMKGFDQWERGIKPRHPPNDAYLGMFMNKVRELGLHDEIIDELLEAIKNPNFDMIEEGDDDDEDEDEDEDDGDDDDDEYEDDEDDEYEDEGHDEF